MHPRFLIFSVISVAAVLFLSSETAFSVAALVTSNTSSKQYRETAQDSPNNNSKSEIIQLNKEGIALSQQSLFPQALQRLQKALATTTNTGERLLEAVTLNNIGRVYQNQGQYLPALQSYLKALFINKELSVSKNNSEYARVQLGKTYSNIGYLFDLQKKQS